MNFFYPLAFFKACYHPFLQKEYKRFFNQLTNQINMSWSLNNDYSVQPACWIILHCSLGVSWLIQGANTKFDDYINRPDDAWTYEELTSYRYENMSVTLYILNMTSQRWMSRKNQSPYALIT